jgi:serine protease Do
VVTPLLLALAAASEAAAPRPAPSPSSEGPPLWTEHVRGRGPVRARGRPAEAPLPLADLADRARPAVVHLRATLKERKTTAARADPNLGVSVGSGFIVEPSGYVVTNEHVVRGAIDVRVKLFDGRELAACVVGADAGTDIALLKVSGGGRPLPTLPLGDSDAVRVGETVVAIGSPFGFNHSVTAGIVSAKERVIEPDARDPGGGGDEGSYVFFIQTDASINLGNSGGPLVDAFGAVVGVNAAYWGGPQPSHGVGFAIPINIVKVLLPRLHADGEAPRSYLGVDSQPLTAALVTALGLPALRGALIAFVEPGSAAELAGLEVGDVIVSWAGRPVATRDDFKIYAQLTAPGARVRVGLVRDGKTADRIVLTKPAARQSQPRHPSSCRALPSAGAPADGFEVAALPADRAKDLPGKKGVLVARVDGGAAREAGLVADDVILRVGRVAVGTPDELRGALAAAPAGRPVPLLVMREGWPFWTALPRP